MTLCGREARKEKMTVESKENGMKLRKTETRDELERKTGEKRIEIYETEGKRRGRNA